MKKKTFIVQLLDSKQPSRTSFTQVEDANFYSNDTDASLVFIPHEEAFNFETAKVVMYNRGDESLVERDAVVTTENGRKVASYELPAEIIAHWGDWTAQPVFTSGGEIYSGSIVPFSVIRYLMHERPATLTEIVTVTEFIQQSQVLVDDMEQAEAQRVSAETSRLSAETQRLSNETTRVSAEAQRKTDHANRSAELDGKANKKQEDWITPTLLNGWAAQGQSYNTPVYRKNQFGTVELKGILYLGAKNTTAFNLPSGYRPTSQYYGIARSQGLTIAMIDINVQGRVLIDYFGSGSGWVSLSNISFDTA